MWQFICGFCGGIYVGTYFECKPTLEKVVDFVKTSIPDKKDEEDKKKRTPVLHLGLNSMLIFLQVYI